VSDNQLAVEVVRGEMQPWSDYSGKRGSTQGPVLQALLDDVLPSDGLPGEGRALILGPHGADLIQTVIAKAAGTTVLVRSVSDATALTEQFGDKLQVVTGALDGLVDADRPRFDVVIASSPGSGSALLARTPPSRSGRRRTHWSRWTPPQPPGPANCLRGSQSRHWRPRRSPYR
jgi:hypothetical protein